MWKLKTHLFNAPSISLATSLRKMGEEAGFAWKRFKSMLLNLWVFFFLN